MHLQVTQQEDNSIHVQYRSYMYICGIQLIRREVLVDPTLTHYVNVSLELCKLAGKC